MIRLGGELLYTPMDVGKEEMKHSIMLPAIEGWWIPFRFESRNRAQNQQQPASTNDGPVHCEGAMISQTENIYFATECGRKLTFFSRWQVEVEVSSLWKALPQHR